MRSFLSCVIRLSLLGVFFILSQDARCQVIESKIRFADITDSSGLLFKHQDGSDGNRYLIELMGAGICSFDADGDGLVDVFMLNGYELTHGGQRNPEDKSSCTLFKNREISTMTALTTSISQIMVPTSYL